MHRSSADQRSDIDQLSGQLRLIRLDEPDALDGLVERIRVHLEATGLVLFCPIERLVGWGTDRLHVSGTVNPSRFKTLLQNFLARAPHPFWGFDPLNVAREEQNRITVGDCVRRCRSDPELADAVFGPMGIERYTRVLLCGGSRLIACLIVFGTNSTTTLHERLIPLISPLLRRLEIESALRRPFGGPGIDFVLDQCGSPAYLVTDGGELLLANVAGRMTLTRDRGATVKILQDALAGDGGKHAAECVRLPATKPPCSLITLRCRSIDQRIDARVDLAARRWKLTPRQRDVLRLVSRGHGNANVATVLGVCERTVELHMTRILEIAGVDRRASLVSHILAC